MNHIFFKCPQNLSLAVPIVIAFICSGARIADAAPHHSEAASVADVSKRKDCSNGGEQEMVACVVAEYKAADLELNRLYKRVKAQISPEDQKSLISAQRVWIKHRDAQCALEMGPSDGDDPDTQLGTSSLPYSGQMNNCLARLTLAKIKDLKAKYPADTEFHSVNCKGLHVYGFPIEPKDVPREYAEVVPFIPKGQRLIDLPCGDIRGDGTTTYLLVTGSEIQIGTLSLLTRQLDGSLQLDASNKTVIQAHMLAGMSGGYKGIDVQRRAFTINNSFGGGGVVANYAFTFRYSAINKTWTLESVVEEDFDGLDQPLTHTAKKSAKTQLGLISFSDFDGTQYGIVTGE